MLLGECLGGLVAQDLQILTQNTAGDRWVDDIINKAASCCHLACKLPQEAHEEQLREKV